MRPASLQLDNYFVESFRFESLREFDPDSGIFQPDVEHLKWNLKSAVIDDGRLAYRLTLSLEDHGSRYPYSFEIVIVGAFGVDEEFPEEDSQNLADANAPAVLYGAARELISNATGRGPYNSLCLPSVTFNGIERKNKKADPVLVPPQENLVKAPRKSLKKKPNQAKTD